VLAEQEQLDWRNKRIRSRGERVDGLAAASDIERAAAEMSNTHVSSAGRLRRFGRSPVSPVGVLARVRSGRPGHRSGALRPTTGAVAA